MDEKYQSKYRISSTRLATWDYGRDAAYYVTLCTVDGIFPFGKIEDGEMKHTPLGQAAMDCWLAIPDHFPFVVLDEFVIMPNHMHGIIIIDKSTVETQDFASPSQTQDVASLIGQDVASLTGQDVAHSVETQDFASLPLSANQFGPQSRNLASIIRGYKIGVTKYARQHSSPFEWQARYYDHIIRDTDDHERIRKYISANPQNWSTDQFHRRPPP